MLAWLSEPPQGEPGSGCGRLSAAEFGTTAAAALGLSPRAPAHAADQSRHRCLRQV